MNDDAAAKNLRSVVREFEALRDRSLQQVLLGCQLLTASGQSSEQVASYLREATARAQATDEQWFRAQIHVVARPTRSYPSGTLAGACAARISDSIEQR
jgi:hypothetical protein